MTIYKITTSAHTWFSLSHSTQTKLDPKYSLQNPTCITHQWHDTKLGKGEGASYKELLLSSLDVTMHVYVFYDGCSLTQADQAERTGRPSTNERTGRPSTNERTGRPSTNDSLPLCFSSLFRFCSGEIRRKEITTLLWFWYLLFITSLWEINVEKKIYKLRKKKIRSYQTICCSNAKVKIVDERIWVWQNYCNIYRAQKPTRRTVPYITLRNICLYICS